MSDQNRTRPLAPGPSCATYEPLLALHHMGELDHAEGTSLRKHLANCDWCRERLSEYGTLYGALLRQFGHEISAPPDFFTLDDIVRAVDVEDAHATTSNASSEDASLSQSAWPVELHRDRRARPPFGSGWAAVAAVLLVALLTAALFRLHGPPSAGSKEVVVPGLGTLAEFPLPVAGRQPRLIVAGRDGAVWFTENGALGRITPAGRITEYPLPGGVTPGGLAAGPDGNLWFTEGEASWIGRLNPHNGVVTKFSLSASASATGPIIAGPDGSLWFVSEEGQASGYAGPSAGKTVAIGRITLQGVTTEFPLFVGTPPWGLAAGLDGNLWFTSWGTGLDAIGRISPSGAVTWFTMPHLNEEPNSITAGYDGNLWFTEPANVIGRITPQGAMAEFPMDSSGLVDFTGLTAGPDGHLWAVDKSDHQMLRITSQGVVTRFALPSGVSLDSITLGPDGNLWSTDIAGNAIVRIALARDIPPPTLDPTSEAYVSVLRTYYPPFIAAEEQEWEQCALPITHVSPPQVLAPCRPVELAAITAAQTLVDHLAATPPPARWQAQDAALKQALRETIAYNTERIHDINAKAVVSFYLTRSDGNAAGGLLCTVILQIDRGPPPLSPGFPVPGYAQGPDNTPGCVQG